jgi:hypothetical protein
MSVLFGDKTVAWFDVWSLEHLISGMSGLTLAAYAIAYLYSSEVMSARVGRHMQLLLLLCMAYLWECIEHYLEAGYTGIEAITYWFQGVEFWGNRLITDPLLMVLGGIIAQRYSFISLPARIFSGCWITIHVGFFPHSMYLHALL